MWLIFLVKEDIMVLYVCKVSSPENILFLRYGGKQSQKRSFSAFLENDYLVHFSTERRHHSIGSDQETDDGEYDDFASSDENVDE